MFCPKCGHKLPDEAVFCSKCGHRLSVALQKNDSKAVVEKENKEKVSNPGKINKNKNKKLTAVLAILFAVLLIVAGILAVLWINKSKSKAITRADWAQKLYTYYGGEGCANDSPYFSDVSKKDSCFEAVQYCAEWEIIDRDESKFKPNDACKNSFAIITAVKSLDLDLISASGVKVGNDKEILEYFDKNSGISVNRNGYLDEETADKILTAIGTMRNGIELPEKLIETKVKDNVKTVSVNSIANDNGSSVTVVNEPPAVGEIVLIEACKEYPSGRALKVTAVNGNKVSYVEPELDEVFENLDIEGTFVPQVFGTDFSTEDYNIELITNPEDMAFDNDKPVQVSYLGSAKEGQANNKETAKINLGDLSFKIGKKDGMFSGKIKLSDCTVNVMFKMDVFGVQKAYLSLNTTIKIQLSLELDIIKFKLDKLIPPIPLPLNLCGVAGLTLKIVPKFEVSIKGTIEFSYDFEQGVSYERGRLPKFIRTFKKPDVDLKISVDGFLGIEAKVNLEVIKKDITDVGLKIGFNGSLTLDNKYGCENLNIYLTLELFVNSTDSVLAKLNVKASWVIFNKNNSPLKWDFHLENGRFVDKCTKSGNNTNPDGNATVSNTDYREAAVELIYNLPKYGFDFAEYECGLKIVLIDIDGDKIPEIFYWTRFGMGGIIASVNAYKFNGDSYEIIDSSGLYSAPIYPARDSNNKLHFITDFITDEDLDDYYYDDSLPGASFWYNGWSTAVLDVTISNNSVECSELFSIPFEFVDILTNWNGVDEETQTNKWREYKSLVRSFNSKYTRENDYNYIIIDCSGFENLNYNEKPLNEVLDYYHQIISIEAIENYIDKYENGIH